MLLSKVYSIKRYLKFHCGLNIVIIQVNVSIKFTNKYTTVGVVEMVQTFCQIMSLNFGPPYMTAHRQPIIILLEERPTTLHTQAMDNQMLHISNKTST